MQNYGSKFPLGKDTGPVKQASHRNVKTFARWINRLFANICKAENNVGHLEARLAWPPS